MSRKIKFGKAARAGIGYTIGNVLIKGINFVTLPIFSRILTTEEFGIYNVFIAYESILFVLVGMALHTSVKKANYEFSGKINEYMSSISLIYILNLGLYILFATLFLPVISNLLNFEPIIVYSLIIYSFSSAILSLYNYRISLDYSYKKYLAVALSNSLGNVIFSFLLMLTVFNSRKYIGRILGVTIPLFIITIYILVSFFKKARAKFNEKYWKFGIVYSLPIIPHGISQVLLSQCDRIMINSIVGATATGVYSLAGNIKLILTIITDSITSSWSTWFFEHINEGHIKLIRAKSAQILAMFTLGTVGLIFISPELIDILGGKEYAMGKYVAVPMILDAFCLFAYSVIVQSEYYMKKTKYIMLGTLVSAVINIILNYVFINIYGFIAAAYTTLFSYICYLLLHYIISRKIIGFNVIEPIYMILYSITVCCSAVLSLCFVDKIVVRYIIAIIILLLVVFSLWFLIRIESSRYNDDMGE